MAGGTLLACCICGEPTTGGTCGECAHVIAVSISGLIKHPDLIGCCGNTPVAGPCPGCAPCNTIIRPPAPNGTFILRSCALPANGCAFMADLHLPYTPPGAISCPCNPPWSDNGIQFNDCTVAPPTLIRSWIAMNLGNTGPGGSMTATSAFAVTIGSHSCTYCCFPFGNPNCVTSTGDYQGQWTLPGGNSSPPVSLAAFCAGTPFVINGVIQGTGWQPCGFNGPGTHTTTHQGGGPAQMTIQLVS